MAEIEDQTQSVAERRVAWHALLGGAVVLGLKFGVYWLTGSVAVLSDGMESIINLLAAGFLLYSVWLSGRPADEDHPYGHGKVEFMTLGLEGWMILSAGVVIGYVAVGKLIWPGEPTKLEMGTLLLGGVNVLNGGLAFYVLWAGRKYGSPALTADGKHLLTDFVSTLGVVLGLVLIQWTGKYWLDPVIAMVMATLILVTSWKLLWQAIDGLMDKSDPKDHAAICAVLDEEVKQGAIAGYHKVRHRHTGSFHWVDMHLQVDPTMDVKGSHELASRIEYRVEQRLGRGKATAHVEPY